MPVGAKIFDIAFTVFVYLLAAAILIGAILFAFSASPDKSLFGYRYYTVLTPSMTPTYKVGDMIFVKITDASEINVGDVITFNPSQNSDAYLTHRVTEKLENFEGTSETCFRTKGDANDVGDSFLIDGSRVIGKVTFGIPGLGYVVRFIQLRWYLIVLIAIMIGALFLLLKRYFLIGKGDDDDDKGNEQPAIAECVTESVTSLSEEAQATVSEKPQNEDENSSAGSSDPSEILPE